MNIRDLQYIIAVAETRHFGKAADRCFVSQPTLSGQIKKLEQELGVVIFERSNRSVETTPAGEDILHHARQIMEQADAIKQIALEHQDPMAGPLRIGAIPTLSPYLMPLILMPLKKKHPKLRLVLSEEMTDVLIERLLNHEIDAALLATAVDEQELQVMPLFDEPFWLAHPRDHAFYNMEHISRKDLENTELLLLSDGHCLAKQAMDVCHLKERKERGEMADLRAASLETLLQLVGAGFGSTLVPALAISGSWASGRGIVSRKLELRDAYRRVSLVSRKTFPRKQVLQAFADVILDKLPNTVSLIGQKKKGGKRSR